MIPELSIHSVLRNSYVTAQTICARLRIRVEVPCEVFLRISVFLLDFNRTGKGVQTPLVNGFSNSQTGVYESA